MMTGTVQLEKNQNTKNFSFYNISNQPFDESKFTTKGKLTRMVNIM